MWIDYYDPMILDQMSFEQSEWIVNDAYGDLTIEMMCRRARLSNKERRAITMYYKKGHTQERIAKHLKVGQASASKILQRARNKIKCYLVGS